MSSLPENPQLELTVLVKQYSERFGHGLPMDVLTSAVSTEQLIAQIKAVLAEGRPVSGWSEAPMFDIQARPAAKQEPDDEGMDDPEALKKHNMQSGRGPRN